MVTEIVNLRQLVDDRVTENVAVQETHVAKQEVLDAVADAELIADQVTVAVVNGKVELTNHTNTKILELDAASTLEQAKIEDLGVAKITQYNDNVAIKVTQYNDNHTTKFAAYNANDTLKINQYNDNHIARLENINFAYADRIVEMIKTRNFMGIMDEYVAQTETHMITFLDTTDANYIYYGNGTLLELGIDYTVYDSTTIELVVKTNPYDVIVQINTQVLLHMLTAEDVLFEDRIGAPNGVAGLDENGLVPAEQLPSYVDDVIEVATYAELPVTGEIGKIYIVVSDETSGNDTSSYRWTGTTYAMVSNTLTAADVKALYEANLDTNAYTDAEKTLVDVTTVLDTTATTLPIAINEVHGELDSHVSATGAHGVTEVLGAVEVQTITNKVIDDITNKVGSDHVHYKVRNESGSTISKGTVVTAQGVQTGTDYIEVVPITDPQTQIAIGIVHTDLLNNGIGLVTNTGVTLDYTDTSAWVVGTILYPNTTGGLTSVKPASGRYQACAYVMRSHGTQGRLLVEFTEPKYIASTSQAGYVQLNDTLISTSIVQALTANQGKELKSLIDNKEASGVSITPQGNLSSINVQLALEELQTDIDTINATIEW